MQGPARYCQMCVCVCGVGKGVGVHEARINTLILEVTGTLSLKRCQAVVAEQGFVGSQQCSADYTERGSCVSPTQTCHSAFGSGYAPWVLERETDYCIHLSHGTS